jgi:predicted amidophosphoribosyltransferase
MGILQLFVDSECAICHESGTALCRACEHSVRRRYLNVAVAQRMASYDMKRAIGTGGDAPQDPQDAVSLPVFAAARYDAEIQLLILATKKSGHPRLIGLLADLATDVVAFAAQMNQVRGLITLVPLHSGPATRTATGTDLVLTLAKRAARGLRRRGHRAVVADLLMVRPSHKTQKGLNRGQRERNASQKYRVATRTQSRGALMLFDDVMTTGASMGAADLAMLHAGRLPVAAAVIAHRLAPTERTHELSGPGELTRTALEAARGRSP